jgi:hypothetical protein
MSVVLQPPTKAKIYTEEDLWQMPGDARYELIRGELCPNLTTVQNTVP